LWWTRKWFDAGVRARDVLQEPWSTGIIRDYKDNLRQRSKE
jgi:hypothetical protein